MSRARFKSNYPQFVRHQVTVLPTPQRVGALPHFQGDGIVIAYVDSGFSRHADIEGRVILHADAGTNHIVETPHVVDISPLSWHGQMTSVIGSGDGRSSSGLFTSIAPKSKLVLVKVSTPDGRIKEPDILRGLRWVYETRHRTNVRVVNISVGGDFVTEDPNNPLFQIVKKLHMAGIVVAISAGNANAEYMVPPASAPHAITVGGYDDQNTLDTSQWKLFHHNYSRTYTGITKPELVAPSAWIASPLLPDSATAHEIEWLGKVLETDTETQLLDILNDGWEHLGLEKSDAKAISDEVIIKLQARLYHHKVINSHYQHVDGTSVATPIVSSVIAQMLQANPRLQPDDIKFLLQETALLLPDVPTYKQGAGRLNARDAVLAAQTYTPDLHHPQESSA